LVANIAVSILFLLLLLLLIAAVLLLQPGKAHEFDGSELDISGRQDFKDLVANRIPQKRILSHSTGIGIWPSWRDPWVLGRPEYEPRLEGTGVIEDSGKARSGLGIAHVGVWGIRAILELDVTLLVECWGTGDWM